VAAAFVGGTRLPGGGARPPGAWRRRSAEGLGVLA
jgi:hypothetical protein